MNNCISIRQQVIDQATKEVVDDIEIRKTLKFERKEEDQFYMVYFKQLGTFFNLKDGKAVKVCMKLMEYVDYNTNTVDIYQARRKDICKELGISETNWSKYVNILIDKGILIDQGYKRYKVNPMLFWKGDSKTRAVAIEEYSISYERVPKIIDDKYVLGETYEKEETI